MKPFILFCMTVAMLAACGNNTDTTLKDPSETHPPSEAIPDSMAIVSDSAIVPDTATNSGAQVGASDSPHQNQ